MEVRSDRLRVERRRVEWLAVGDADRRVVLLREVGVHGLLERAQAAAAGRLETRVRAALQIRAGIGVGREDVRVDGDRADLAQAGVLPLWIDGVLGEVIVRLRADELLEQRRDVDDHGVSPPWVGASAPRAL